MPGRYSANTLYLQANISIQGPIRIVDLTTVRLMATLITSLTFPLGRRVGPPDGTASVAPLLLQVFQVFQLFQAGEAGGDGAGVRRPHSPTQQGLSPWGGGDEDSWG